MHGEGALLQQGHGFVVVSGGREGGREGMREGRGVRGYVVGASNVVQDEEEGVHGQGALL